jgi:hypothetical protein
MRKKEKDNTSVCQRKVVYQFKGGGNYSGGKVED